MYAVHAIWGSPLAQDFTELDMKIVDEYWISGCAASRTVERVTAIIGHRLWSVQSFLHQWRGRCTYKSEGRRVIGYSVETPSSVIEARSIAVMDLRGKGRV